MIILKSIHFRFKSLHTGQTDKFENKIHDTVLIQYCEHNDNTDTVALSHFSTIIHNVVLIHTIPTCTCMYLV